MSGKIGHNSQRRQTVYRTHGNRAHTAILNSFLQDSRISHETKGLVAEMLSYPADWDFTVLYLTKNGKSGRDKIYRMLKEAEKFGYVVPFQYRALDGKIQRQTYLVSDDPDALIRAVAEELHEMEKLDVNDPVPEKAEVDRSLLSNPFPEKPFPENKEVDPPLPEKPDTAQPDTENPTQTNNIYNKNTQDKDMCSEVLHAVGSSKRSKSRKSPPESYSKDFDAFWELYPWKKGKGVASTSWERLTLEQKRKAYVALRAQLPELTARKQDARGNFCPMPATWINQGRFDDEVEQVRTRHVNNYSKNGSYSGELL